jgi:hypothetical protein
MVHSSTVKAAVKKVDSTLKVISIKKHKWGLITVKVSKQMVKSTKIGLIFGEWNGDNLSLEKTEWL